MRKNEIAKATDSELFVEYVRTYASYAVNVNLGRGTEKLGAHVADLEREILKRGLMSQAQIDSLNR